MLLESLSSVTDNNTENALLFVAECREVILVATQVTSVPPRARHADGAKTGATNEKGQTQAQPRESMIYSGAGGQGYSRPGGAAPGYGG
jgi:hypothetical protein